jgi:hypothetical protein
MAIAWTCIATGDLWLVIGRNPQLANAIPGGSGRNYPEHFDWPAPVPHEWGNAVNVAESKCFGVRWRGGLTVLGLDRPFKGVQVVEAGWPFKSLRWTEWFASEGNGVTRLRVSGQGPLLQRSATPFFPGSLSNFGWAAGPVWRRLPLDPIWPGLAADTALVAATLLAFIILPIRLLLTFRRKRRLARGACPRCGYDLRGRTSSTCPECGSTADAGPAVP